MYDLGDCFKMDLQKAIANNECVFKGNKYRITVLTERLVRLEYSEKGIFEDRPTQLVWYRNFPKPEFTVKDSNTSICITTKYFELRYLKDKSFLGTKMSPTKNLKIRLTDADKTWYYGHPEIRNYGTSVFGLNDTKDRELKKGLFSIDGFVSIDDSKTCIMLENGAFQKRDSGNIDIYVFLYNKDFYFCLSDYFMLTGHPPLIPRYALGNWWDKKDCYNEFDIAHLTKKFEDKKVPISVFISNHWQNDNSFEFNENYKTPQPLIAHLKEKNIKFGLSIEDPKIFKSNSKTFEKLKQYLPVDEKGDIPFNVFDERNIDAFLKILIHPLNNMGIDLYSITSFDKKNLERYTIFKHYLYNDGFRNNNKRPLITAYNSKIAAHRYPILYAGKSEVGWSTLKKIISFNAMAANMGISFFSHDIGGTTGGIEDNELFIRFVELGVFCPILRLGADSGKYYKREPWKWGLKVNKITTDFLNLRHRLIPYLYTESYKYHKYGKPLIEPIYYQYPVLYDDVLYRDEYFFGSTFLVSPITTQKEYLMNRVIQKFYIPDGLWYEFFSGMEFKGNKKYVSFYRDHEYPVFVKAGAIIPMAINEFNETGNPNKMEIQVFPGANNTYSIYEDDGETNNYLNNEFLITNVEFIYQKNNYKLTILPVSGKTGIIPSKRDYKIKFRNTKPTTIITSYVGNTQVNNKIYKEDSNVVVEINDVPTNSQLTIVCRGQDIEIEAFRIINDDITSIISDLPINTMVKQKIDDIMFSKTLILKKKRIELRKLANGKERLERKYVDLLLKLLEYINEV